jgi:hypothetical protein
LPHRRIERRAVKPPVILEPPTNDRVEHPRQIFDGASAKSISAIYSKPMLAGSFSFAATSSPWPILRTSLGG